MPKIENLDDLLKIPISTQVQHVLDSLQSRRKELADLFYHKNTDGKYDTSYDKKMEVFDELEKLHKYFSYKLPNKPYKQGGGGKSWTATKEQRHNNCDDLIGYLKVVGVWDALSPFEQGMIVAKVWGSVKQ